MIKSGSNSLDAFTSNKVKHLVINFDNKEFLVFVVNDNILEARRVIIVSLNHSKSIDIVQVKEVLLPTTKEFADDS